MCILIFSMMAANNEMFATLPYHHHHGHPNALAQFGSSNMYKNYAAKNPQPIGLF